MERTINYNTNEFHKAINLIDKYPSLAKERLQTYVENYPFDYMAYPFYIDSLVTSGEVEEASIVMKEILKIASEDEYFQNSEEKYEIFQKSMIMSKIRMLSYLGKYKALERFYRRNAVFLREREISIGQLIFYCKKQLGQDVYNRNLGDSNYMYIQMEQYSEEEFFNHIKKHLTLDEEENEEINNNIFLSDFPIHEVIEEVKKYIPSDKCRFPGFMSDTYIFRYDGCGRDCNRLVDYFKVVCFHNTSDIITAYPVFGYDNWDYVDLNYMHELKEKNVKRLNMIDKFNKRYRR